MKLVDFLEQFTPAKFDWEKADDLWLEIANKYKIDHQNVNVGDWVEVQPAFIALFDLIRAGAFEDYPQPASVNKARILKELGERAETERKCEEGYSKVKDYHYAEHSRIWGMAMTCIKGLIESGKFD